MQPVPVQRSRILRGGGGDDGDGKGKFSRREWYRMRFARWVVYASGSHLKWFSSHTILAHYIVFFILLFYFTYIYRYI